MRTCSIVLAVALALTSSIHAADIYGLEAGQPELKSAGPLAFGDNGILFIADPTGSAVFAVQTGEKMGAPVGQKTINVQGLNAKVNAAVGVENATISDLAVNPETGSVYVSVNIPEAAPRLLKVGDSGELTELKLENIPFAKSELPNIRQAAAGGGGGRGGRGGRGGAPVGFRNSAITDLAYSNGVVFVSGAAASQGSASNVWSLMFPFQKADNGANVEIFHANHGREEANSPMTTFIPFMINGEPNILAGYVCTPLVKFPVKQLADPNAEKVKGVTLAELGNQNVPLDMIAYNKGGADYLLITNSARGVMKVSTEGIDRSEGLTTQVAETAGQKYETIEGLGSVVQLDKLNDTQAVILVSEGDSLNLKSVDLP